MTTWPQRKKACKGDEGCSTVGLAQIYYQLLSTLHLHFTVSFVWERGALTPVGYKIKTEALNNLISPTSKIVKNDSKLAEQNKHLLSEDGST